MHRRQVVRWLVLIIGLGIAARLATAWYLGDTLRGLPGTADQFSYHNLALRVLSGHGFTFGQNWWPMTAADAPTAHWSYLYTLFLAGVYRLFGPEPLAARILQGLLLGVVHPFLAYRIGRMLFGRVEGLLAAGLTALYTYFVYYEASLMTEGFYITAVLASLYAALRLAAQVESGEAGTLRWAFTLGVTLGIAALLRQVILLFVPVLFLWLLWRLGWRRAWQGLLLASSVLGVLILPITAFNYLRFERFVLLNTNAGFAFFWANHPIYGTRFLPILPPEIGSYAALIPPELRGLDEAALDRALLLRGLGFVLDDPVRYMALSLSRVPVYFQFWPSAGSSVFSNLARVLGFGLLWPFMVYGVLRAWRREPSAKAGSALFVLFVVIYSLIHVFSWALIRYRLPVDGALMVFAGLGLADLARRAVGLRQARLRPAPAERVGG